MDERKNRNVSTDDLVEMFEALKQHDSTKVKELLQNGFSIDHIYRMGTHDDRPLILLCADSGSVEIAELLVGAGVDANKRDSLGWTALHVACDKSDLNFATFLLNNTNVNVNCVTNLEQMTPLHMVCRSRVSEASSLQILSLLLKKDCELNRKDYHGFTALDRCLRPGRSSKKFLLLLENGGISEYYRFCGGILRMCVNVFENIEVVEKVLQRESWYDSADLVRAFESALSTFCDSASMRLKILQMFLCLNCVNHTDCPEFLHAASQDCDYKTVKYLLARGCPYAGPDHLRCIATPVDSDGNFFCSPIYDKNEAAHINETMCSYRCNSINCVSLKNLCRVKIRNVMCEKHKNSLLDLEEIDKLQLPALLTSYLKLFPEATMNT